jgi:hypothetical protein
VTPGTARPQDQRVIHDVVLHMTNDQPMLADLFELPDGSTTLLRCTNLRQMNGKRPIFVDDLGSIFFFPMDHLRFIEVLPRSQAAEHLALGSGEESGPIEMGSGNGTADELDEELEIDEDFLRRVREA